MKSEENRDEGREEKGERERTTGIDEGENKNKIESANLFVVPEKVSEVIWWR